MVISNGTTDDPSQGLDHQSNGAGNGAITGEVKGLGAETLRIVQTRIGEKKKYTIRTHLEGVDGYKYLPGQPRIALSAPPGAGDELVEYLRKAHLTTELDRLLPFMKYIFVSSPVVQSLSISLTAWFISHIRTPGSNTVFQTHHATAPPSSPCSGDYCR